MAEKIKKSADQTKEKINDVTDDTNTQEPVEEHGGVDRLEPTRYGDWEKGGRCIDF